MNVFSKVFGTRSQREVKRIMPLVEKTESYQSQMQQLTDEQLRDKTREYKKRLAEGATLDDLLPEAFATVREAAKRVLGMEHYRVQIIGGIILHQGRIAEMKTGEGKTLVSTLPAYLNALEGKGVHIVTVNDYLAKRDAEWMGKVHEFLGLTVGVVLNDMKPEERRAAYGCDITYVTNNELGFDYLRDNMVIYKEQLVQRDLHYCIIDEIDSVLIDEARTPLIISGQSGKSTKLYEVCDILAQQLERGEASHEMTKMAAIMGEEVIETGDFVVNEKDKIVNLTEQGIKKVEKFFNIENLADPENLEIQHNIILALRAHNLMHKDQDYVVKDDEILIVDEFTGRIMPGRRYSDGLHQAIEAKEHVKVKRESKTLATITFQNFFNKYDKKGGMTGTALTEEKEFRDIYGMDVVEIPTNRPVQRKDLEDAVEALLYGARGLRSGVGHRRGAKAGLVGEYAAGYAALHGLDDADAQRAAHYRRGVKRAHHDLTDDFGEVADVDKDKHEGGYDVDHCHYGDQLLGDLAYALDAADEDEPGEHRHDRADGGQRDAERRVHTGGKRVGLHARPDAERGQEAEDGKEHCEPAGPQTAGDVVHGTAYQITLLIPLAEMDSQRHLCKFGTHTKNGRNPHPEHSAWSSNGNGSCYTGNISCSNCGRQSRTHRLKWCQRSVRSISLAEHPSDGSLDGIGELADLQKTGTAA